MVWLAGCIRPFAFLRPGNYWLRPGFWPISPILLWTF